MLGLAAAVYAVAWAARAAVRALGGKLEYRIENDPGMVTLYAIAAVCTVLFAVFDWRASPAAAISRYWAARRTVWTGFLLSASVTILAVATEYLVFWLLGAASWHTHAWQRFGGIWAFRAVLGLGIVVLLATTEELIFRGFVFNYLRTSNAPSETTGAVLGSALIFALVHHFPGPLAWPSPRESPFLIGLFLLGVLLAVTYLASGSLACAVGVHAGLLTVEVFGRNRRTRLVAISQSAWWMGTDNDLRTAPIVWAQFIILAIAIWWARRHLSGLTRVEPP